MWKLNWILYETIWNRCSLSFSHQYKRTLNRQSNITRWDGPKTGCHFLNKISCVGFSVETGYFFPLVYNFSPETSRRPMTTDRQTISSNLPYPNVRMLSGWYYWKWWCNHYHYEEHFKPQGPLTPLSDLLQVSPPSSRCCRRTCWSVQVPFYD